MIDTGGLNMTHSYLFSIVMAAYNAERYLCEAVDSLKDQTIGFENIQLIIVNDGSTDHTGALADELSEGYPNIRVLHKENGGASSARNFGLPYAEGRYLNFMDADDKLSPETLENVYHFFQAHETETDVVVIPMIYFDGQNDEHALNFFRKETCVADLEEHPDYVAMSMSSSFVRADAASDICFDTRLSFAEDARVLLPILLKKRKMGIVSEAIYWYRRHGAGAVSTTENTLHNTGWYQPYLDYYCMAIIHHCLENYGGVPAFIQHTLAYDLQLRIKLEHIPDSLMTEEERKHYLDSLFNVYSYIEDSVILSQKRSFAEQKLFILKNKHQALPDFVPVKQNIQLFYNDTKIYDLNKALVTIDFIKIQHNNCSIEGTLNYFPTVMHMPEPGFIVNKNLYLCQLTKREEEIYCLDHLIMKRLGFSVTFPLPTEKKRVEIRFMYTYDGTDVYSRKYRFGKYVPLDTTFSNAYGLVDNNLLYFHNSRIYLETAAPKKITEREEAFIQEVRDSGMYSNEDISLRETVRAHHPRRPIWLVSDRYDQADDNGEAFFIYLRKYHRFAVKPYFVLAEGSRDYQRLAAIGPVVTFGSAEHKRLYLEAQCVISSHADDFVLHPFAEQNALYKDLTAQKPFVFLQHGVIKDDMSGWLNRYNKNFAGFVTTTRPEYQSILDCDYAYTEKEVWLTGLPRHDRLYNDPQKLITVMPTWRRNLLASLNQDNHWVALPGLETSDYVTFYRDLFREKRLQEAAKTYGYTLAFKPHPAFMDFLPAFALPAAVKVFGNDEAYRDIFAKSSLVLTDYSSVVFDFAYLRKPVMYCQSDREAFFSGEHIYSRGYFDYERDGFGEVTFSLEDTVDQIISYMENGCTLKDVYKQRIEAFYAYHDKNCCKRVYKKIRSL